MRFWSPSILAFPFVLVWAEQQPELPGESILNLYLPSNWSNTSTAALLILQSITIGQYQVKVLGISSLAQLPLIMVGCMVRTPCLFHPSSQQLSTFAKPQSLLSSLSLLWRWLKRKVLGWPLQKWRRFSHFGTKGKRGKAGFNILTTSNWPLQMSHKYADTSWGQILKPKR